MIQSTVHSPAQPIERRYERHADTAVGAIDMRRLGLKAGERSFIRNVAIFMSGRSAASAITFLLTPVIARLYAPEDFGMAAGFLAAVAVIGPLSCAGYDKAITVARSVDDARRLFTLCVTMAIIAPVVVFPVVALLSLSRRRSTNADRPRPAALVAARRDHARRHYAGLGSVAHPPWPIQDARVERSRADECPFRHTRRGWRRCRVHGGRVAG